MVSFLLLLLLPGVMLATVDKVCFKFIGREIYMSSTNVTITERRDSVECKLNRSSCVYLCEIHNSVWFNVSENCYNASVEIFDDKHQLSIAKDIRCTAYLCKGPTITNLMNSLDSDTSAVHEMRNLIYVRESCEQLFKKEQDVKKSYVKVEKEIIHKIMGASGLQNGDSRYHNLRTLSLNIISFNLSTNGASSSIQVQAPKLLPQNDAVIPDIELPVNALQKIPQESRIVTVVSYSSKSNFQFQEENISSMVIRIELLNDRHLRNLDPPIKMTFRNVSIPEMDNESFVACSYFDENDFKWKTDGCETYNETSFNQTDFICYCDHTTPFAVLLMRTQISEIHWKILSYISYIGCGLSAFFTACSIVIYVFSRTNKMDFSISIHVSLSGALFLLNTTFLLTEWGATVKADWVCVFIAAFMHYSLLCCFTWMAIEALHLYFMLIKVFNTNYKHYLVKLSVSGWGVPGVIVAVTLGFKDIKQFYGVTQMSLSDVNQTNAICWITDETYFYSLNLVYFTLIFMFNAGILVAVSFRICKMKQVLSKKPKLGQDTKEKPWKDPKRMNESCRAGVTVFGLTCLMGTSWGLAFLGSGYVNYPILYLFCILNSLQGFFIFLWICLTAKKQRKREMEDRLSSTPARTTGTKSE